MPDEFVPWMVGGVNLHFRAQSSRGDQAAIWHWSVYANSAWKLPRPARNRYGCRGRALTRRIHPINSRLRILIGAFHRTNGEVEENVAAIGGPAYAIQKGLLCDQLLRLAARRIHQVNPVCIERFPPLGARAGQKRQALSVWRSFELLHPQRRRGNGLDARRRLTGFGRTDH